MFFYTVIYKMEIKIFTSSYKNIKWKKKYLHHFNKKTPLYAGLGSKQQNV